MNFPLILTNISHWKNSTACEEFIGTPLEYDLSDIQNTIFNSFEDLYDHKDDIYCYPDCESMIDVAYYFIDEYQALSELPT